MATTDVKSLANQFGITLMNEAQAALSPRLRELHQAVLSAFTDAGEVPTTAWLAERARRLGLDPGHALTDLARADLVHTAEGHVLVAYPFSGLPTPHRVELDNSTASWAMCGGDALGIPLMTGRDATITSTDPHTGDPVRVRRRGATWEWEPDSTVMLVAGVKSRSTAAEAACRHVHFFTRPEHAEAYLRADAKLGGEIYDQASAVEAGQLLFGSLLDSTVPPPP